MVPHASYFSHVCRACQSRVLLVKTQSPEAETSQGGYMLLKLYQIHCQVISTIWSSLKIIPSILNMAFHSMIGKQRFVWWMNFGVWFVVYSLVPWSATRKLFHQMESFLTFFLTSPAERVWGHHDLPFASFGIQRKIFHTFTHSFNKYWVSQKTVYTL